MKWTSVLAIYWLLWVGCAFILLPFGVRTHDEAGLGKVPGQADSAPAHFRPGKLILRATVLAAILCALYYANYVNGWIEIDDLNMFGEPPGAADEPAIYRN
ncbi:MAG: DUF1467 family protein [Novosphingobium sp.]|nr:DUF1467 family protein [Novosphingobium sp.]